MKQIMVVIANEEQGKYAWLKFDACMEERLFEVLEKLQEEAAQKHYDKDAQIQDR